MGDFLEGRMDLKVVLPSEKTVRMSVERRTPMMDLLVQITTAHRINPGGHVIQVMNARSDDFLYYKPSTPIGALDTSKIHIVPKQSINDSAMKKAPMKMLNLPFEATFRLQVRLPRQQLYVCRVSPKTSIQQILDQVCQDKGFNSRRYELRKTDHTEERLRLTATISDYGLTEVALVHVNKAANRSVSTSDILRLQEIESRRRQLPYGARAQSSAGDSSISSGSGCASPGDRPTSPAAMSTLTNASGATGAARSATKKRRAPPPPGPPKVQPSKSIPVLTQEPSHSHLPSKSVSLSNLNHGNLDRVMVRDGTNLSTISSGSVTSISSLGKKKRAPAPPPKQKLYPSVTQISIPEETPSMVHLENNHNFDNSAVAQKVANVPRPSESSIKDLTLVKRVLPEVPTKNNNAEPLSPPPTYEESEAGNSNT